MDEIVVGEGPSFERELPKAGSCAARIWRVFSVGVQPGFNGGEPKPAIVIYFVLPYKYQSGPFKGKRMLEHVKYVAGMGKFETIASKRTYLRLALEAVLNRPLTKEECTGMKLRSALEGQSCMVQIVHKNGYANVNGIMSMPDGMPPINPEPEADPPEGYIPEYITKLLAQALPQESAPEESEKPTGESTRAIEEEIGRLSNVLGPFSVASSKAGLQTIHDMVKSGGITVEQGIAKVKSMLMTLEDEVAKKGTF